MMDRPPLIDLAQYSTAGFDRGATRWKEALWLGIRWIFFQTILPWPSSLRVAFLRLFGARVGHGVVIRGNVNITFPWRVVIGNHVWFGEEVLILSLATVTIEDSCCISQRAFLCTGSHNYRRPTFDLEVEPIVVGRGSWIAAQAFVGPGVEMGEGSVAAAGAVVMESVEAHAVVAGNPAKVVKRKGAQ